MTDFAAIRSSVAVQAAYARTQDMASQKTQVATPAEGAQESQFAKLVAEAAQEAVNTVRTGDSTAQAGLTGQANMQQIVEATMAMESTVRVSVAVRDKLVEAYQEVIRMPI